MCCAASRNALYGRVRSRVEERDATDDPEQQVCVIFVFEAGEARYFHLCVHMACTSTSTLHILHPCCCGLLLLAPPGPHDGPQLSILIPRLIKDGLVPRVHREAALSVGTSFLSSLLSPAGTLHTFPLIHFSSLPSCPHSFLSIIHHLPFHSLIIYTFSILALLSSSRSSSLITSCSSPSSLKLAYL